MGRIGEGGVQTAESGAAGGEPARAHGEGRLGVEGARAAFGELEEAPPRYCRKARVESACALDCSSERQPSRRRYEPPLLADTSRAGVRHLLRFFFHRVETFSS